ncbi:MAG: DNA-directed RNA polymerase subunit A' [Candidatus Woesearchaeota archaeon]
MQEDVFKVVDSIKFELLSPKVVEKMANVKVVTPELYDKEGYPVDGGLMDTRMGVISPGLRCRTCGGRSRQCMGHFGHIELARPVLHIKFIKYIKSFLRNTCKSCGRVLLSKNEIESARNLYERSERLEGPMLARKKLSKYVKKLGRRKDNCPHCGDKVLKINLDRPYHFKENKRKLNPIEIRARLEKIPDEDLFLFGFDSASSRPEWMVLSILPVPPVTARPSITLETGEKSEDDLTHKMGEIVRINQRLFENINAGAPEVIVDDLWDLLQFHVSTYYDNTKSQLPVSKLRGGNLAVKSLIERLKSKSGRIRLNLLGKRVDFSSRSVISPDPMLSLNEVGVPKEIAMNLTVPEYVTEWNTERIKTFIMNGNEKYPGANYIKRPDGRRLRINSETKEQIIEEIQPGYIVERHLMDGDISIFNRQPSLHKHSMMALYIKVLEENTFKLNPAICFPYNADFDGDEMNLHMPQTIEAQSEARMLMDVNKLLVTPKNGEVIIGLDEDPISGCYYLTKFLKMSKKEAIDLLMSCGVTDFSNLEEKEVYTGKDVMAAIFPNDLNFETADGSFKIVDGKLVKGVLDSSLVGAGSGTLIRKLSTEYDDDKAGRIIEYIFRIGLKALTKFGFTISLKDMDVSDEVKNEIESIWEKADKKANGLIDDYKQGKVRSMPGKSVEETFDEKIQVILDQARTDIGDVIAENTDEKRSIIMMFDSGARGNILNLAQIAGSVGQQALRGSRINYGYKDRSLSCYKRGELSPESRGYIKSNFRNGMKPEELFFASITGRDGLMDMGLRTPKSGYLYRRLSSTMQDFHLDYDETVRDGSKDIIQFKYGTDGLDVSKTDQGKLNVKSIIRDVLSQEG